MRLIIDEDELNRKLFRIVEKKQKQLLKDFEKYLVRQNKILGDKVLKAPEFRQIKGSLKGEFGFTDEQIDALNGIINTIKNDQDITRIVVGPDRVALEWVDFEALKAHPIAQHKLTQFNPETKQFDLEQIVSWVDWLENGLSITGYVFEEGGGKFSRSGEGRMQKGNGVFRLPKTKMFETIAQSVKDKEIISGISVILSKKAR